MDWEDVNKLAFWMLVQTDLLQKQEPRAMEILYQAMRIKKAAIPTDNLPKAVKEFLAWEMGLSEQPEWITTSRSGGIA